MHIWTDEERHEAERAAREAARGNSCRACQMTLRPAGAETGLCYLCRCARPCSARND